MLVVSSRSRAALAFRGPLAHRPLSYEPVEPVSLPGQATRSLSFSSSAFFCIIFNIHPKSRHLHLGVDHCLPSLSPVLCITTGCNGTELKGCTQHGNDTRHHQPDFVLLEEVSSSSFSGPLQRWNWCPRHALSFLSSLLLSGVLPSLSFLRPPFLPLPHQHYGPRITHRQVDPVNLRALVSAPSLYFTFSFLLGLFSWDA